MPRHKRQRVSVNDVGGDGTGEPEENDLNRFLQQRKRRNVDSTYHPSHDKKAVATIPRLLQSGAEDDEDRELPVMLEPLEEVHDEDLARLRQATSHLPDDVVLRILCYYEYDVDTTIEVARMMVTPDLMPEELKQLVVANIAMEKDLNPTKKNPYKDFYFGEMLKKSVNTKTLVNFYYQEKNKLGGNWRMEHDDPPETPEMKAHVEAKMKEAGISFVARDPSVTRQLRGRRETSARLTDRTRRSEVERLQGTPESDPSEAEIPAPTSSYDSSQPSTSSSHPPINLRFRYNPSLLNTPQFNVSLITTPRDVPTSSTSGTSSSGTQPFSAEPVVTRSRLASMSEPSTSGPPRSRLNSMSGPSSPARPSRFRSPSSSGPSTSAGPSRSRRALMSSPSNGISGPTTKSSETPKRKRSKRSIEQLRNGPPKTYPLRKPSLSTD